MMGKIFNLEFRFLTGQYKALVSVNSNTAEPYVHIQLLDHFFKRFFTLEHIRYRGFAGYKKLDQYRDPLIRKIVERLGVEIERELRNDNQPTIPLLYPAG